MKTLFLFLIIFFSPTGFAKQLIIPLGGIKNISTSLDDKVSIANGRIARVIDHRSYIAIHGKNIGETSLRVGNLNYNLAVVSQNKYKSIQSLSDLLQNLMGLEMHLIKKRLIISGKLYRFSDWQKLIVFFQENNLSFEFHALPVIEIRPQIEDALKSVTLQHGLPTPTIQWEPKISIYFAKKIKDSSVLEAYGLTAIYNEFLVDKKPLIKIRVHILETHRNALTQTGIKWPTTHELSLGKAASTPFQVDAILQYLQSSGRGKLIADPVLTCESGSQAKFHSGGEIPVVSQNKRRRYVEWKSHGIELNISPVADSLMHIQTQVEAKISFPTGAANPEGIPSFKINHISTSFNLKSLQSLALSGLIENFSLESTAGIAGLSQIPLLGRLFSSRQFLENQTELTILVTPEVIHAAH